LHPKLFSGLLENSVKIFSQKEGIPEFWKNKSPPVS
jgi:hypothetical protein